LGLVFLAVLVSGCGPHEDRDVLYLTTTREALLEGVYRGAVPLETLLKHGDFGIGTFDALDGEMVLMDGQFYQIGADGAVRTPGLDAKTPLAAVAFFNPNRLFTAEGPFDLADLEGLLDKAAPDRSHAMAIRITGVFKRVKARGMAKQEKPCPRLLETEAAQAVFEYKDVKGTLVGFRFPEYLKGTGAVGYHLHFLTADRKAGGHVVELETEKIQVELQGTAAVYVAVQPCESPGLKESHWQAPGSVDTYLP
jgi:acetolactate decarboxylase